MARPAEIDAALLVLYRKFRNAWLLREDCMDKRDVKSLHERMVRLSDVINDIEGEREP